MWAFLITGLASLGASAVLFIYMKLRLPLTVGAPSLRETWRRHWSYGRWTLASSAVSWVPFNIFYPLLSSFSGMAQAGELKALMNFNAPVLQTSSALSPLLLPYTVRVHKREGWAGTRALTWRITLLSVSGTLAFWLPLVLFKGAAFRLLYSGRYTEVASLLPVVALASLSWSAFFGIGSALLAMEYPASVFVATLVSGSVSMAIGIPAAKFLGVRGAVWAIALSETLAVVMAWVLLRRKVRRGADSVPTPPELSVSR
jgi:O-antigen/teichoic acid export membrane protein